MRRRGRGVLVALSIATMALPAACSGALSPAQARNRAARICDRSADRAAAIRLPGAPSGAQQFLARGIAVLAPEIRTLRELGDDGRVRVPVSAMQAELAALRSTLKDLHAGDDPVVAIRTLQQQLLGLEQRANTAWRTLRVPACVSR